MDEMNVGIHSGLTAQSGVDIFVTITDLKSMFVAKTLSERNIE